MSTLHSKRVVSTLPTADERQMMRDMAKRNAVEAVQDVQRHLEGVIRELKRYEEQLCREDITMYEVYQTLGFVVHHVSTNNGPRLDLLLSRAGEAVRADVLSSVGLALSTELNLQEKAHG